ncbi:WhiB family transcriptional regulator [Nonomuraea sp. CA-141351]|uniref:WhiB family transcriptional regulator n=1 Tax=Nonomuraea sp. CA-141351 TaxID=3239996 RepID=UPI003D8FFC7C
MKTFTLPAHPGDDALTRLERSHVTEHWTTRAGCAQSDPDLFFQDAGHSAARRAKAICRDCPVVKQCLAVAVRLEVNHGIWGGLLPEERRHLHVPAEPGEGAGRPRRRIDTGSGTAAA